MAVWNKVVCGGRMARSLVGSGGFGWRRSASWVALVECNTAEGRERMSLERSGTERHRRATVHEVWC